MTLLSVLCFVGGVVFLIWTFVQVLTRGWGPLDVSVLDVYFVVVPRYLLIAAIGLLAAGLIAAFAPHP